MRVRWLDVARLNWHRHAVAGAAGQPKGGAWESKRRAERAGAGPVKRRSAPATWLRSAGRLGAAFGDHRRARGDRRPHPARRDRRLRERDGGGAVRRRPRARRRRARWRSAPTGRASTSPRRQRRRGALQPQHDHRGDQPARRDRRLRERDGGGDLRRRPCARRRVLGGGQRRTGRASTSPPTGSDAVARLNRNTTTGAITQPAGTAGCISETGAGPCADGHALDGPRSVAVSADGKSVYVASYQSDAVARLNRNTTTGAISPARRGRRLRERDGGGALRRRPCARQPALGGGQPPTGRASTSPRTTATPWRASTATRPPGRSPSPPGPPAASARPGRAVRRRPCARRPALGGGQRRREERLRRLGSSAAPWRASTATRPPGRSPSPPGPPAASARRGRGRAPTAMGSAARAGWRSAPTGRASTSPRIDSDAVARLNRGTTAGAIAQPAGTAGCVSETGAGTCADGHGLDGPQRGGGQRRREERLRRLHHQQRRGALQPGALRRPNAAWISTPTWRARSPGVGDVLGTRTPRSGTVRRRVGTSRGGSQSPWSPCPFTKLNRCLAEGRARLRRARRDRLISRGAHPHVSSLVAAVSLAVTR